MRPLVIDLFLSVITPELAKICKLLIAMVIYDCEKQNPIQPKDFGKNDWVRLVVHQLIVGCEQPDDLLKKTNLTFVTFNYDLSLENRLYLALEGMDRFKTGGIAKRFVSETRIYHVYGQLHDFDPSMIDCRGPQIAPQEPGPFERQKMMASQIDTAYKSAQNLRTIAPDEKTVSPEVRPGIDKIREAEQLYILGYGFDPHNNKLLQLGERPQSPRKSQFVHFTNLENHNKINKRVAKLFDIRPNGDPTSGMGDLMGESYRGFSPQKGFYCEKSIQTVYRALAEDFDWPD